METTEYWPMAWEYGIWNATIASLQFWTEDLDPVTLAIASECVYTHFFWTPTSHTLCQLSEEALFGRFRSCIKCSFYTTAIAGRWRLWEWFQQRLTNTLMAGPLHTPCVQYGACIFRPHLLYSTSTTWPASLRHPVISSQTSSLTSILQWWPKSQHLPSMHGHFQ